VAASFFDLCYGFTGEQAMKSDEEIIEELKQLTEGLLFMSESDYPFEIIYRAGDAPISLQYFRELSGQASDAPVEVRSVDDFFRAAASEPDWKGEKELAIAKRYQALARFLKENLDELKVYRVGKINIPVYIIGRTKTGNWVGLSTRAVET
jgi:hypothetical protein